MRFGNDAIAWARNRLGSHAYDGLCERFVRLAYGFGPDYGSAKQAWNAAGAKHAGETSPPPAVPVFWNLAGPNSAYGHVALSIGGGRAISTSNERGYPGVCIISIAGFTDRSAPFLGWAEIYHGTRVYTASKTTAAWYDRAIDGEFGAASVTGLQRFLAHHGFYRGAVDGTWGPMTWAALQRWLASGRYYTRAIDGAGGPYTIRALQNFLKQTRDYPADRLVDGVFGVETKKAFQRYLAKGE